MELTVRDPAGECHPFVVQPTMKIKDLRLQVAEELGLTNFVLKVLGVVYWEDAESVEIGSLAVTWGDEVEIVLDKKQAAINELKKEGKYTTRFMKDELCRAEKAVVYADAELTTRDAFFTALNKGMIESARAILSTDFGTRLTQGLAPDARPIHPPIKHLITEDNYTLTKAILELGLPPDPSYNPYRDVPFESQHTAAFFDLFVQHGYRSERHVADALQHFLHANVPEELISCLLRPFPNIKIPIRCVAAAFRHPALDMLLTHSGGLDTRSTTKHFRTLVNDFPFRLEGQVVSILNEANESRRFSVFELRKLVSDAARRGLEDVVGLLVGMGAPVADALSAAQSVKMLKLLVEKHGATLDQSGVTALHHAVEECDRARVEYLVSLGADCTCPSLILAAARRDADIATILLEHGADPEATTANGSSTVTHAAWEGRLDLIDLFTSRGAPAGALTSDGKTLAMVNAASKGKRNIVEDLVDRDPSTVAAVDVNGRTVLMHLGLSGKEFSEALVTKLLPTVDYKCNEGFTALDYAVRGNSELVRIILQSCPEVASSAMSNGGSSLLVRCLTADVVDIAAATYLLETGFVMTVSVWTSYLTKHRLRVNLDLALTMMRRSTLSTDEIAEVVRTFSQCCPRKAFAFVSRSNIDPRPFEAKVKTALWAAISASNRYAAPIDTIWSSPYNLERYSQMYSWYY